MRLWCWPAATSKQVIEAAFADGQPLGGFDVITWQEKLTGRMFDPTIEIVLLQLSKPRGIKVQGQTFLHATDYDVATTVRIAAHEMLHPPVASRVLERPVDKLWPLAQ